METMRKHLKKMAMEARSRHKYAKDRPLEDVEKEIDDLIFGVIDYAVTYVEDGLVMLAQEGALHLEGTIRATHRGWVQIEVRDVDGYATSRYCNSIPLDILQYRSEAAAMVESKLLPAIEIYLAKEGAEPTFNGNVFTIKLGETHE